VAKITSKISSIDPLDDGREARTSDALSGLATPIPKHPGETTNLLFNDPLSTQPDTGFKRIKLILVLSLVIWLVIAALISIFVLDIGNNQQNYDGYAWAGFATLIAGPLMMVAIAYYALKQLANINLRAAQLANAAERLSQPDRELIGKTKIMADIISAHIDGVNERISTAVASLDAMEEILKAQTGKLETSNKEATKTAAHIATSIQKQYAALDTISGTFDQRMNSLSGLLTKHTDNLAAATRLAEQKIKEARMSVENAATKINTASDTVRANTVEAASNLTASHEDIKAIGDILRTRSDDLSNIYSSHTSDLTAMIETLRKEQEGLGVGLEARLVKMRDLSLSAQASAESLSDASQAGKQTVEALAQSANLADNAVKKRFREMQDMVHYSSEHAANISDKAAQRVRDSLELARKEISRIEDHMGDLQARISKPADRSLELIEDVVEETPAATPKSTTPKPEAPKKKKWTRLKLKPLQDDALSPEQKTPLDQTNTGADLQIPEIEADLEDPYEDQPPLELSEPLDDDDNLEEETVTQSTDNILNRPGSSQADQTSASTKSKFSLRNLFGNNADDGENASLSIATLFNEKDPQNASAIVEELSKIGFSPNAIVDDGCIIEAAATRVKHGHESMSKYVADHLKSPVEHLAKTLSKDDALSARVITFATDYNQSIESLAGRRAAVRSRLETEEGRAYLLCDAALNFGRV